MYVFLAMGLAQVDVSFNLPDVLSVGLTRVHDRTVTCPFGAKPRTYRQRENETQFE